MIIGGKYRSMRWREGEKDDFSKAIVTNQIKSLGHSSFTVCFSVGVTIILAFRLDPLEASLMDLF